VTFPDDVPSPPAPSGLDPTTFDPDIRAQDDLFRHVNGPWLRTTEIPADRATAGAFVTLFDEAEKKVRAIIETCRDGAADDEARKIGELYASFMDEDRAEALGADPIRPDLARVDEIRDVADFARVLGSLERAAVGSIVGFFIGPDRGQPDRYITHLFQGGISLPDESYYREEGFTPVREAFVTHVARMLDLAGFDEAETRAKRVMELETRIAAHHWDRVRCRDTRATYNLLPVDAIQELIPPFDLAIWAKAADVPHEALAEVVVAQPSFLEGLATLLIDEELEAWRDWLRWQIVHGAAPYLSGAFVQENFDFYGKTLSGTDELRPRWKRGVGFVEGAMGEAVGKIYVASEFPAASRERMSELIDNLIGAYRDSIQSLEWMSDATKQRALEKLARFTPKIGHPQKFKDYSALVTDRADLVGNARSALSASMDRELDKLGKPIDRDEWYMTPQTINAYYNPTMNEIVFPAAILQPPFFDPDADDAVNYGAIGAVIGHEIGHGFDDQGSKYDGTGALNDWWTDDDRAAFDKLADALIEQFEKLSPEGADGQTVNGSLTIGENIGDLGGLGIAYKAFQRSEPTDALVDGLTADQRFFLSWAQAWQAKVRPAEVIRRLTVDPHSPPEFRCNQTVRNIDAFYTAFGVTPEDALWLDPAERVSIW
jgi:putative endopeptidase